MDLVKPCLKTLYSLSAVGLSLTPLVYQFAYPSKGTRCLPIDNLILPSDILLLHTPLPTYIYNTTYFLPIHI